MTLNNLLEEYFTIGKIKRRWDTLTYNIFKNPSKKEIKEVMDEGEGDIRGFYSYETKDIYIWNSEILHENIRYKHFSFLKNDTFFGFLYSPESNFKDTGLLLTSPDFPYKRTDKKEKEEILKEIKKRLKLNNLSEEFFSMGKIKTGAYSVFKNPSKREINEILKDYVEIEKIPNPYYKALRFLYFYKTDDIYAWAGNMLHFIVIRDHFPDANRSEYMRGLAEYITDWKRKRLDPLVKIVRTGNHPYEDIEKKIKKRFKL